jgi:hypothetical protein
MQILRSMRWLLLAMVISLVPASSYAGVLISVGFAPPVLPVYVQPPCPEPGLMWTPGYWAYGAEGYYWVPGAWVPAPYIGALWTPGYWGWSGGFYVWHLGYWGPHVGYYGGVNYGFGYGGIGFAGGYWRGGVFAYNTAIMHVGVGGGWGGRVYEDRAAVDRGFVARDSRVAFSGGPGGIHHDPSPDERLADRDQHRGPSDVQQRHAEAARADRTSYARNNGGNPAHGGVARPMGGESHGMAGGHPAGVSHGGPVSAAHAGPVSHPAPQAHAGSVGGSHPATAGGSHPATAGGSSHASSGGGSHAAPASHASGGGGGGGGKHK